MNVSGSKKYPQFNVAALEKYLPEAGIKYVQNLALGGRRKPREDSSNTVWKNEAFRGYADYTESDEFKKAIADLVELAGGQRTAYMCS